MEFKRLEGVWADERPKGQGRQNALRFQDGKMGWQSIRFQDGEPLSGHAKGYEVKLDTRTKPKQITLTHGEGTSQETRLGVYELDGDTLRMSLGWENGRPASLDDKDAQALVLKKVKSEK